MSILKLFKQDTGEDRFIELLRPHVEYLYRLAYRFCGAREDAEDLVQDLLVKLYPKTKELEKVDNLQSWLATVLYRQFVDRTRAVARSPVQFVDNDDVLDTADTPNRKPDNIVQQGRELDKVEVALQNLNDDQRALVVLHEIEGYRLTELQDLLGVPMGTLKSRLHRAREQLKKSLQQTP